MATYEIEMNGQKFSIDAPDDQAVTLAVKQLQAQQGTQGDVVPGKTDTGVARLITGQPASPDGSISTNNVARSFATGVPIIGGLLNTLNAGTNAALSYPLNPLFDQKDQLNGSFADRYQQSLDQQNGMDQAFHAQHPYVDTGLNIAGGVAGTIPAVMAAPAVFGAGGGGLAARTAVSAGSGMVLGGTDASIRSGGDTDQTRLGSAIGLVAGAAAPAIGQAVGAGVRYLAQPTDAVSNLSSAARNYITNELADPVKLAAQQADLTRLGPQATLADVSPEWLGVARGAASRPGSRDAIVNALQDRQAQANARLAGDLDASLGQAVVPSQVDAGLAQARDQVAQQYGPIMANATRVDTQPLANQLDAAAVNLRGPAQQAVNRVRGFLNIPGTDALDPNPQALLSTRQAIDGLVAGEQNPQVVRQLTVARQQVDDLLDQAAPGIKDVDAQYAELARQSDALQQGRPILNNGATALRPQEVDQMLTEGALPQGRQIGPSGVPTRMQQGVRAEIDRAAGTNAVDTTAVRNIVRGEGDWNRQKLASLFGPDNADAALNAIDRETTFGQTANRVTSGSDTAMGQRFGDFLDAAGQPKEIPSNLTALGIAAASSKKVLNALLEQRGEATASQFANDLGRVSVASGSTRDQLVNALIARAQSPVSRVDPAATALISAILNTSGREGLKVGSARP